MPSAAFVICLIGRVIILVIRNATNRKNIAATITAEKMSITWLFTETKSPIASSNNTMTGTIIFQ
jgi:hypothetical protein